MVAQIVRRKRLHDAISAIARLSLELPELHLSVAGGVVDPDYFQELQDLIARLNLSNRVSFLGPRNDVFELMRESDALVHTAESEAFGMVIIEAMAAGLPVVSSAVDGPREIIEQQQSGLLVALGDVSGFAQALKSLAENPQLKRLLAANARQRVETCFSSEHMAQATADIYGSLCRSSQN